MGEIWPQLGSLTGSLVVIFALFYQFFYPNVHIKFYEYGVDHFMRGDAFGATENYLSVNSISQAKVFRARVSRNSRSVLLSIDENEEVTDVFGGVKVWWSLKTLSPKVQPLYSSNPDRHERRYYKLTFHKSYLEFITESYVPHVLEEGKAVAVRNRERKLYTNNPIKDWQGNRSCRWNHVVFEHPGNFDTLALDPKEKHNLMNDLSAFSQGKEYYARIGKAWKQGYLLYRPPGTGKSTMIAAMSNFLNYDVYDLELTTVKDNSELKRLMIETSSKSIIVIEDIDCSLDLTGQRKKKEKKEDKEKKDPDDDEEEDSDGKVTLSGVLNSIDGLWSACGGERIIVFTTNYVDKLDPALIRKGRMDKHIELAYCRFEAFKVLAKNYLDIDSHKLFEKIRYLLEETSMTPADVADNLMCSKSFPLTEVAKITYLENLIGALEKAKVEARKKAEEEVRLKAEKEEKEKERSAPKDDEEGEESSAKEVNQNNLVPT